MWSRAVGDDPGRLRILLMTEKYTDFMGFSELCWPLIFINWTINKSLGDELR